jgi:hypothetical protein
MVQAIIAKALNVTIKTLVVIAEVLKVDLKDLTDE